MPAPDAPMKARLPVALVLAGALALPFTAMAAPSIRGSQVSVEASDVQQYLGGTFPQTHDALGGLLELTVSHPQLKLPPGNRLNLSFDLAMATAGGAPTPVGNVALSSELRYDTARQGFFLEQPTVDAFQPAQAGGRLDSRTRELLNVWLADYARREPIYKLDPAVASLMGTLQVESAAVENGRLVVHFNQNVESLVPASLLQAK